MYLKKYLILLTTLLVFVSCTSTEKQSQESHKETIKKIKPEDIPKTITMLFVTQPHCPSCDKLEETMKLEKPAKLIQSYFIKKKIYLGEKLPEGLIPPNGTPTVYFLGYKDAPLLEPMIGEKDEEGLMMFLEDALLEFETAYGVDLQDNLCLLTIKE
jgi:hypothetical protein